MSSHNVNKNKEILYLKVKSLNESNKPLIKRSLSQSYLNDFNKIFALTKNAIKTLEKGKKLENYNTILILNHPVLTNVYIYSKEQWELYYNYNIIEQCINNKVLKMNYNLTNKNESLKINPNLNVKTIDKTITEDNVRDVLKGSDILIDAVDNVYTRVLLSRECTRQKITFIHSAVEKTQGQLTVFTPNTPSYEELFKKAGIEKSIFLFFASDCSSI